MLEAIAGVLLIIEGRICINGCDIASLPPEKRRVGIVYQDYAILPHLSVWQNITYGLRYSGMNLHQSKTWVQCLMESFGT